jgi:hypothetical protein
MLNPIASPSAAIFLAQRLGQPVSETFTYGAHTVTVHGSRFDQAPEQVREEYADDNTDTGYLKTESSWLWYFQFNGEWYSHEQQYALKSVFFNAVDHHENPYQITEF